MGRTGTRRTVSPSIQKFVHTQHHAPRSRRNRRHFDRLAQRNVRDGRYLYHGYCVGRSSSAQYPRVAGRRGQTSQGRTCQPTVRGRSNEQTSANDDAQRAHYRSDGVSAGARKHVLRTSLVRDAIDQFQTSNRLLQGHPPNPASSRTIPNNIPSKSRVVPIASVSVYTTTKQSQRLAPAAQRPQIRF